MNTQIQTALRLALEAKRVMDLIDIEVHRTRRGHWAPSDRALRPALPDGTRTALVSGRQVQRAAGLA